MKILVDADACPVKEIIETVAKSAAIPVVMFIDTSHMLASDYSEVVTVGQGRDAVDYALINRLQAGDIVVTQDYGVAALALSKQAYAVSNSGMIYTKENIDFLLMERHVSASLRRQGIRGKNHSKRTQDEDKQFLKSLLKLCNIQ